MKSSDYERYPPAVTFTEPSRTSPSTIVMTRNGQLAKVPIVDTFLHPQPPPQSLDVGLKGAARSAHGDAQHQRGLRFLPMNDRDLVPRGGNIIVMTPPATSSTFSHLLI